MPWADKNYQREYMRKHSALPAQRARRAAYSKAHPEIQRKSVLKWEQNNPRNAMVVKSRSNAKQRGIEHTVTVDDIYWPTHCPVLGIELCYERDKKFPRRDNYPTFDRKNNQIGYVPGNVFVISWRANRIKWDCTPEELEAVARYANG